MLDLLYFFWEIITGIGLKGPIWIGKMIEKLFFKTESSWEEQSHLAVGFLVLIIVVGASIYFYASFGIETNY